MISIWVCFFFEIQKQKDFFFAYPTADYQKSSATPFHRRGIGIGIIHRIIWNYCCFPLDFAEFLRRFNSYFIFP